jgi:hypothetical protein
MKKLTLRMNLAMDSVELALHQLLSVRSDLVSHQFQQRRAENVKLIQSLRAGDLLMLSEHEQVQLSK